MANRLWGGLDFLSRRNSSQAAEEDSEEEQQDRQDRRKSSARVQTLGSMRARPGSSSPSGDTTQQQQQQHAAKVRASSAGSPAPGSIATAHNHSSASSLTTGAADGVPDQQHGTASSSASGSINSLSASPHGQQHDSASSALTSLQSQGSGMGTPADPQANSASNSSQQTNQQQGPAGTTGTAATSGAGGPGSPEGQVLQVSATSLIDSGSSSRSGSGPNSNEGGPPGQLLRQQQQEAQSLGDAAAAGTAPGTAGFGHGLTFDRPAGAGMYGMSSMQAASGAGDMLHGMQQQQSGAGGGLAALMTDAPGAGALQQLLAALQREAGLSDQQAASAAALLQRYTINPATAPTSFAGPVPGFNSLSALLPSNPSNPAAWQAAGNMSPSFPQHALSRNAAFLSPAAPAAPAASMTPSSNHYNPATAGQDSGHSSTSTNAESGAGSEDAAGSSAGFSQGLVGGLGMFNSPEMVYGLDGKDTPGTAQVAVHNVPFKWCNADLEALFRQLPGYLDAQLLFHENGRSKGVGVALFTDRGAASEAVNRLTGAQADGRKLELVLMNPENHISFSCKQVAVLGLPWEYTAADVRALIEAAAEADGEPAAEAGVDAVEVAYREDGKSEGRAISTFRSRRQAHAAISRLHGRETLAGLRMRLFYLHEQQQPQQLLAQMPQSLLTSLGQLSLESPSPAFAAAPTAAANAGTDGTAGSFGVHGFGPQAAFSSLGSVEGDVTMATFFNQQGSSNALNVRNSGEFAQQQHPQHGGDGGSAPAGSAEGGSERSSFDKDQGPVILHVSGLMESVSREQLRELLSQAGEVTKVDIPDGGRSMGYGFITFSNPQAAEQAMLLFNNYPLAGGAIHVAYSTSATAKARQLALRQARKATLGARISMDGAGGMPAGQGAAAGQKPSTPRAPGPAGMLGQSPGGFAGSRRFEDQLAGAAGVGMEGMGFNPGMRHSFDQPGYSGYSSPGGPGFFRNRAVSATAGLGVSPGGLSPGSMAGLNPAGVGALNPAGMGASRGRRGSFGPGAMPPLSTAQLHHLQLLQAAGGLPPAAAAAAMAAGLGQGVGPALEGLSMEQLQLLIHMGGDAAAAGFTPPVSQGFGPPGAQSFGAGMGLGGAVPGRAPPGIFQPPAAPPGAGMLSHGGLLGAGGLPAGFMGHPSLPLQPPGAAGGMFGGGPAAFGGPGAGMEPGAGGPSTQVLVTGLPAGLDDAQLAALFELCGPLQGVSKVADQDFVLINFESVEGAIRAVQVLNNTFLPGCGTTLSVQFAPSALGLVGVPGAEAPATPAQPTGEFRQTGSAAGPGICLFGAGVDGTGGGLSTPQRPLSHHVSRGSAASGVGGAGDSFPGGGAAGGSAAGSGSLWAAPDAASGLSASSVGGFDTSLRLGHASPVPAGVSAPWASAAGLAAGTGAVPGSPVAQGRPPVPGYSRTVGSSRQSSEMAPGGAAFFSPMRSTSPVGGMPGASPAPGGPSVYASPLYQATMLGNAGDVLGKVASSSALTQQSLGSSFAGTLGSADYGSSGNLHQQQQAAAAHAAVDELPSAALAAAWGDLASSGNPAEAASSNASDSNQ